MPLKGLLICLFNSEVFWITAYISFVCNLILRFLNMQEKHLFLCIKYILSIFCTIASLKKSLWYVFLIVNSFFFVFLNVFVSFFQKSNLIILHQKGVQWGIFFKSLGNWPNNLNFYFYCCRIPSDGFQITYLLCICMNVLG